MADLGLGSDADEAEQRLEFDGGGVAVLARTARRLQARRRLVAQRQRRREDEILTVAPLGLVAVDVLQQRPQLAKVTPFQQPVRFVQRQVPGRRTSKKKILRLG